MGGMAGLENLNISDDEEEILTFQRQPNQQRREEVELCLVGRFLTMKPIMVHIMKERLATVLQPVRGVATKELEKGVMDGGPWQFDGHLLILGKMEPGVLPTQVPLSHALFWVQVHDLPFEFMTAEVGKGLGDYIGRSMDYDAKNTSNFWRSYMRIRVGVDVCKPLKRGKKIRMADREMKTGRFKYEILTLFYFLCGLLGHANSLCEKLFLMEEDDGDRSWGWSLGWRDVNEVVLGLVGG